MLHSEMAMVVTYLHRRPVTQGKYRKLAALRVLEWNAWVTPIPGGLAGVRYYLPELCCEMRG